MKLIFLFGNRAYWRIYLMYAPWSELNAHITELLDERPHKKL